MRSRFADVRDIELLIKIRFDYFNSVNYVLTDELRDLINLQLLSYYERHLNYDLFVALVEDDSGNLASSAFLVISEMPANISCPTGKFGKFLNVFTYPQYRNKGYATEALNMLIDEAKSKNLSYIEL